MMYVIFNHDGSVKKSNINEFIQQGSNNVNEFAIQIEGYDISEYVLSATFTLPNGEHTTIVSNSLTTSEEYPYPARKIVLTNAETSLAGVLKMNIQAVKNSKVLTSYTVYLQINEGTEINAVVLITQQQYENILTMIQESGGTPYTAGDGISISDNNKISVDNTVAKKNEVAETYATKSEVATVKSNIVVLVNTTTYPTLADFLASEGEEGKIYWYPIDTTDLTKGYQTYVWENNAYIFAGNTIIDLTSIIALGVQFLTEAPTSANQNGLKFVVLSSEPSTRYGGYLYIITGSNQ